ncbi:MAG TPA: hypothetical protein VF622_16635 [Segetibacter sp.]|jgi:hypothetical protein
MKNVTRLIYQTLCILFLSLFFASCNQFGKEVKIKNNSVYYKDVTEAEAKRAGDFFYSIGYFNDSNDISIQITKPKDSLQLRFVVDKEKIKPEFDESYMLIASTLSDSVFNKAPITVFLADTEMKDIKRVGVALAAAANAATNDNTGSATNGDVEAILRSIEQRAAAIASNVKEVKGNKLYYGNDVEVEKVNALVSYLDEGGYFTEGSGHIAVLLKQNSGYVIKEAFTDEQIDSKQTTDALEKVATSIKQALFNNQSFSFEVCNVKFEPQLSFMPGAK